MRNLIALMVIGIVSSSAAMADSGGAVPPAKKPGIFTTLKDRVKAIPGGVKKGFEGFKNKFKKPEPKK